MRYDFVAVIARSGGAPDKFPPIDPAKDADHTRELKRIPPLGHHGNYDKTEVLFQLLESLSEIRRHAGGNRQRAGQHRLCLGVMGHFVGDGSQPLHTTMHFNGWVGDNPQGYTTDLKFHQWIDGGYFVRPAASDVEKLVEKFIRPSALKMQVSRTACSAMP